MAPMSGIVIIDGTKVETTQIIEITLHSINDVTRDTETIGKVDPYVVIYGNNQLIGKTEAVEDKTSAVLEKQFIIKVKEGVDPKGIKFKFDLMDKDTITEDDALGSGEFDAAQEASLSKQIVHLKYEGKETGSITFSVLVKDIVVIGGQ